jgi:type II secretion system protein G
MLRNQKGFTLMELMIVIVIIGVLAAIGVPAYTGYVNKAKSATCDSNKRSLASAVGLYYAENSAYPSETSQLSTLMPNYADMTCAETGAALSIISNDTGCRIYCNGTTTGGLHQDVLVGTSPPAKPAGD